MVCDFSIETVSPLLEAHCATSPMWEERMAPASRGQREDAIAVKSSAYDEMRGAEVGKSATKKLNRAGEMMEPWGTPANTGLQDDCVPS